LEGGARRHLEALIDLQGGFEDFAAAEVALRDAGVEVQGALAELKAVWSAVSRVHPNVQWHFDLAELNGYGYYTGVVFAAFVPGYGQAIAQGGRYDEIGRSFGRARPAVGFGADLRLLLKLKDQPAKATAGIFAPDSPDEELPGVIEALRAKGERVVEALSHDAKEAQDMGCDRKLIQQNGRWTVVAK
jgi:ATP phosphoribosyltransferase regulatory subunit